MKRKLCDLVWISFVAFTMLLGGCSENVQEDFLNENNEKKLQITVKIEVKVKNNEYCNNQDEYNDNPNEYNHSINIEKKESREVNSYDTKEILNVAA